MHLVRMRVSELLLEKARHIECRKALHHAQAIILARDVQDLDHEIRSQLVIEGAYTLDGNTGEVILQEEKKPDERRDA